MKTVSCTIEFLCFSLHNTDPQSRFSLQESGFCGNHEIIAENFTDNP